MNQSCSNSNLPSLDAKHRNPLCNLPHYPQSRWVGFTTTFPRTQKLAVPTWRPTLAPRSTSGPHGNPPAIGGDLTIIHVSIFTWPISLILSYRGCDTSIQNGASSIELDNVMRVHKLEFPAFNGKKLQQYYMNVKLSHLAVWACLYTTFLWPIHLK